MLTQIEIDGFKTFKDFKVELAPFQVIVGPNGSGKSNLFDALQLLSRLAESRTDTAFQEMRGEAHELFTKLPDDKSVDRIHIAVEMLVDRKVRDDFGREIELLYTRLRYRLEIALGIDEYGLERLYIRHESLYSIPQNEDGWREKYELAKTTWLPVSEDKRIFFISTDESDRTSNPTIHLHIEEHPYESSATIPFEAKAAQRTVLSNVNSMIGFPHSFAAHEELRSLRFFHLNPDILRRPSSTNAPRFLEPDGSNLPTTLARMKAEDKFVLADVSRDMANLVPGILRIKVDQDKPSDKYVIHAETSDQRSFSSQVLSDGTLRLLAIATLRNDPQFHGILCIEEPENGVHPSRLENMARVLREMATDLNDPQQVDEPLRQVLITTHSPAFISLPQVVDSLLFAYMVTHIEPSKSTSLDVTCMTPVVTLGTQSQSETATDEDRAMEAYTIDQVKKYLDSNYLDKAREQLEASRITLNEG